MAEEKILTLNMRKEMSKGPRYRKINRLISTLRKKIQKMYKDQKIIIDKTVNEEIWKRGTINPPASLKLKIITVDEKTVRVEMGK